MKNILAGLFGLFFSATTFAQCSTCTITITSNDATDHSIAIGQTLCIMPTGRLTGNIYISSGGTLCNQGQVRSNQLYMGPGGTFLNYGNAHIDTFYTNGPSVVLSNYDTLTLADWGASTGVTINNSGYLRCHSYWDSAVAFNNYGKVDIAKNIYIGDNSHFSNYRKVHIGGNLYNGPLSNILTTCMMTVDTGWYNNGTITGPTTGCGGFTVGGDTYNSGTVGAHIDICDAGHPTGGVDGSSGTLTGVTYCQCTDTCTEDLPSGIREMSKGTTNNVYPNPAIDILTIQLTAQDAVSIILQNAMGTMVLSQTLPAGDKETTMDVAKLAPGLYILTVESNGIRSSHKVVIAR